MTRKPSRKRGIKYWARLLSVGLSSGIVLAALVIELIYVVQITQPAPTRVGPPPPGAGGREYQPVTFYNPQDKIQLSGWYVPSVNGATVILLHGFGANRLEMESRADILARHGYGVLLYDLRGHGESGGRVRAFGWPDMTDVKAALDFLADHPEADPERVGILGFSIGGQIAIRATAQFQQIQALIADDPGFVTVDDAPPPTNGSERLMYTVSWIDGRFVSLWTGIPIPTGVIAELGRISPRPVLFIDTGQDAGRNLIRYYYQMAQEPKALWEIPDTYHGGQVSARPQEYEDRMTAFFDEALLK